jgi:DNA-binding response OmpR family regulator
VQDIVHGLQLGADDDITKLYDYEELQSALRILRGGDRNGELFAANHKEYWHDRRTTPQIWD